MTLLAVCQTNSSDDISRNLEVVVEQTLLAASSGARAICLPECFALMQSSRRQLRECAEVLGQGLIQDKMCALALKTGMTLFAGSLPLRSKDPKRVYNTSMVFGPDGKITAYYEKIHLFDVELESGEQYLESAYTMAGTRPVVVETIIGTVGLTVCYDLRFPELYRVLVAMGAEILMVPSAFSPTTGPAHWESLLRARAIENFCWVIAAAQTGNHDSGRRTWGHSLVIDPWGQVVAEKKSKTGLLLVEIDRNEILRVRRQMPCLEHRQFQVIKQSTGHPLSESNR